MTLHLPMLPRLRLLTCFLGLCLTFGLPLQTVSAQDSQETYANRLINSHDPYLLLHAHNPVDWYPWGPEALERARRENRPIFVSIGYSTCYWCHVAEREIYSDPQIANLMNQWFVNIKIDREERPDLDRLYMLATQVMIGQGGWPNNLFLTPGLKPFYAGSYFPPKDQNGRPGFPQILNRLHQAWVEEHDQVLTVADRVYRTLQKTEQGATPLPGALPAARQWLDQAVRESAASFDEVESGFGGGPTQFPRSPQLSMLLAAYAQNSQARTLEMVTSVLEAMAKGGVMDQVGAGFHRYSTEPSWSIPHFEKMLYDNAQLLGLYARAYAITDKPFFRQVVQRTAHYLTTEMQAPGGGFYSAQDAEVDGIEGASYVWTREEIETVLGAADARRFLTLYALTPMPPAPAGHGQPSGGVLRLKHEEAGNLAKLNRLAAVIQTLAPLRNRLLVVRQARVQPRRDEKIVTADNALAIIGFAQAGQALHETALTETAVRTADWVWQHAFDPKSGELKHQFFRGRAGDQGFLDDYALLGQAFMTLYRTTGELEWQTRARQVADALLQRFARLGGALATSWDTTDLLVEPPAGDDSVKPSGQSAGIALLLELASTTHEARYGVAARRALTSLYPQVRTHLSSRGALLASLSEPRLLAALDGNTSADTPPNANDLPDSANHVHVRGQWVRSNKVTDLVLTIKVDPGYHINANPASDPYLIATQVLVDGYPDLKVDYPVSQVFRAPFAQQGIAVYQGRITLQAHLPQALASQLPDVSLRVQACNDEFCLAPTTISVPVISTQVQTVVGTPDR